MSTVVALRVMEMLLDVELVLVQALFKLTMSAASCVFVVILLTAMCV